MKKVLALLIIAIITCQGLVVSTPTVRAQPPEGAPEVVCAPFHGEHLGVPHDAWIGKEIVLKGTAHDPDGDGTLDSYRWDFGDGYSTGWISGVDPYVIEARHTYTGTMEDGTTYGPGKFFTAWLYVNDTDQNMGMDSYFIAIRDVSDPVKMLEYEVNVVIDDGLWWLHKQAYRYSSGGIDYARWSSYYSYYTSATAESVLAFEIQGHQPIGNPDENPYVETVQRGLNYVFSQTRVVDISAWGSGTGSPYGDPDTNGNDIGVGVTNNREPYELGMVMMAIAASGDPDLTANTGPTDVVGRTYYDILTDMVDICAWGQNDYGGARGGWRYSWNTGSSDNSVSQWPMMALEAAETNWGITAADFVKTELDTYWLTYSQNADGSFGYSGPGTSNIARTGTGIIGLNYVGLLADNSRVMSAVNWLGTHWSEFGNYYGMYAVMKGMRTADPEITMVGTHDWYAEYTQYLVDNQQADDGWPNYYGRVLASDWAILILTPTVTKPGPVADAGPDVENHPPEPVPVKFDASGSYHADPTMELVWYEWDFESDGTWDYSGPDLQVEHAYPAYYNPDGTIDWDATARDYTATLRVTDDSVPPLQDVDTCVVYITAPPWKPIADPDGPYEGYQHVPVHLDGSGSYDPESEMYDSDHPWYETIATYEWDLDNDGLFDDSTDVNPSWTWETKGTYSVGLRVTDSQPSGPGGTIGPLDVDIEYATVVISEQSPWTDDDMDGLPNYLDTEMFSTDWVDGEFDIFSALFRLSVYLVQPAGTTESFLTALSAWGIPDFSEYSEAALALIDIDFPFETIQDILDWLALFGLEVDDVASFSEVISTDGNLRVAFLLCYNSEEDWTISQYILRDFSPALGVLTLIGIGVGAGLFGAGIVTLLAKGDLGFNIETARTVALLSLSIALGYLTMGASYIYEFLAIIVGAVPSIAVLWGDIQDPLFLLSLYSTSGDFILGFNHETGDSVTHTLLNGLYGGCELFQIMLVPREERLFELVLTDPESSEYDFIVTDYFTGDTVILSDELVVNTRQYFLTAISPTGELTTARGPVSSFTESEHIVPVGTCINFDPSTSYDLDGSITLYEWDFESDGVFDVTTESPEVVSFQFLIPGEYTVTLKVTDNDSLSGVSIATITITPHGVIPEVPLGTIIASATMIIALVAYVTMPKWRRKRRILNN